MQLRAFQGTTEQHMCRMILLLQGYTSAEIFERWAPHVKLTLEFILEMTGDCGICQYCERGMSNDAEIQAITRGLHNGAVKPISNNERVAVHCIEPSHSSYLQLLHIRESLPAVHISTEWHIHNVAMTNQSGEVAFTSDCGSELCHIEKSGGGHQVKAYSVDDFVRAEGIHDIGILKIDAEGFDPDVITGAKTTLEQGKADVVTFEYHGLGVWADTSLESVVNSLEAFGYACYLDGRPTLTRLDAQCWHPDYEFKWWSNVVCVKKAFRELHVAFERMSFRAAHFMHHAGIGDTP